MTESDIDFDQNDHDHDDHGVDLSVITNHIIWQEITKIAHFIGIF